VPGEHAWQPFPDHLPRRALVRAAAISSVQVVLVFVTFLPGDGPSSNLELCQNV
jgi:hypothetical protein